MIGTNIKNISEPLDPWKNFTPVNCSLPSSKLQNIPPCREFLNSNLFPMAKVAGVAGLESNYLTQTVHCIDSFEHPDLPAIMVFIEYICALEGPMWRQIRGMGLSYHYSMRCDPECGLLIFNLYKSSQLVEAYQVARQIMDEFISGKKPFKQVELESAVSGVIYEIIQSEKTVADMEEEAILNYFKQRDQSHSRKLLADVSRVISSVLVEFISRSFLSLLKLPLLFVVTLTKFRKLGLTVECMEDLEQLSVM